mgnify:FL=1
MFRRIGAMCLLLASLLVTSAYAESVSDTMGYTEYYKNNGTFCKLVTKAIVVPNRLYTIIGVESYKKMGEVDIIGAVVDFVQVNSKTVNIKNIRLLSDYQNIPISTEGHKKEVGLEYTTDSFVFVLGEVRHVKSFFETPSTKYIIRITDDTNTIYDVFLDEEHIKYIIKTLTP